MDIAGDSETQAMAEGTLVSGRYRVEERLATGGMGAVYRVRDETRGRTLALKRLRKDKGASERLVSMFKREFHTLAHLAHPRIIEVYEYGIDRAGPYYTMELLDGADLRGLAPLPYREACGFLRDVASSLALLHTRRLLHRDVSPRNVRRTADGRCKLLDFGTMTPFGTPREMAGTPPFVPPEALRGVALDQRADLFGLGALGYFLITGRHAFPADNIHDLPTLWAERSPLPSRMVADVPEPLDRLITSLLSRDPLARPPSAAAVIDALSIIGQLPAEDQTAVGRSYLLGSRLVGRDRELGQLDDLVAHAAAGRGTLVMIDGARGLGKSRLLDELIAHGQTAGAVVIRVGCSDETEPHGVIAALSRSLMASVPSEARSAAQRFGELAHLLPELEAPRVALPDNPTERRARLQSAVTEWLTLLVKSQPVVLCLDDLHRVDEASAAVLLALAHRAHRLPLLLVTTLRPDSESDASAALAALRASALVISLDRFDASQTLELCESLFGSVGHVERLAHRLYEITGGNPLGCMEVVRSLTHNELIQYSDGIWHLPGEFPPGTVAESLDAAMEQRTSEIAGQALRLARLLSLYEGKATLPFCRALGPSDDSVFAALGELVSADIVLWHADAYRFTQAELRATIRRGIAAHELAEHHRTLGRALASLGNDSPAASVEAGWHLLAGGDESHGAELLEQGATVQFTDGVASAIAALEAALDVYERQQRPRETRLRIRSKLVGAAFPVDRRLAEKYGEETLQQLLECTGLDVALRLRARLGIRAALGAGLAAAAVRRSVAPQRRKGPPLREAFALFLPTLGSMLGVASTCLDVDRATELVRLIEPLTGFGSNHIGSEFYAHCCRFLSMVQGREAEAHASSRRFLEQLNESEGLLAMSAEMRARWKGGSWIIRGQMEVLHDSAGALECAEQLELVGFEFHRAWAHQIRMLYYAMRAEMELCEIHRRALDVHFLRNGSVWQLEVGPTVSLCAAYGLIGDVTRMKESLEQLERSAKVIPSLRLYCNLVRMGYRRLRGDMAGALELYEQLKTRILPRQHIGWPALYSYAAEAMNATGQHERARAILREALSHVKAEDRGFVALYLPLERELAVAEAALGNIDAAETRLDALLDEFREGYGPITRGSLHEARARVASLADDALAFEHHLSCVRTLYQPTRHPILVARCERLARMAPGARHPSPDDAVKLEAATFVEGTRSETTTFRERAERALGQLVRHHHRTSGFLFTWDGDEIRLLATCGASVPPSALAEQVRNLLTARQEDLETECMEMEDASHTVVDQSRPDEYEAVLLTTERAGRRQHIGVLAMDLRGDALPPDYAMLRAVAARLLPSAER